MIEFFLYFIGGLSFVLAVSLISSLGEVRLTDFFLLVIIVILSFGLATIIGRI